MTTLLLIGHPGHELRALGWVKRERPEVVMLTHGEGSIGQPRLEDSRRILDELGVRVRSDWLEAVPDQTIYQALLGHGPSPFPDWLAQLTAKAAEAGVDTVVADEAEGYNPSHDLCRAMANVLVERLRASGRKVTNLELPLVGHPCDPARKAQVHTEVTLCPEDAKWKIALARDYARRCSPVLAQEVETMFEQFGIDSFATECLYEAKRTRYEDDAVPGEPPFFERYGEAKLAAGVYKEVIRADHLRALVRGMNAAA